jgi:hypothetical protein
VALPPRFDNSARQGLTCGCSCGVFVAHSDWLRSSGSRARRDCSRLYPSSCGLESSTSCPSAHARTVTTRCVRCTISRCAARPSVCCGVLVVAAPLSSRRSSVSSACSHRLLW